MAGIVSGLRPLKTRKGDRMAVFMLDDVDGSVEVVVFPETFGKHGSLIEADAMLLVRGKLEKDDESARLVATELLPIAALDGADDARSGDPSEGAAAWPAGLRGAGRAAVASPRRPPRLARAGRPRPADRPLRVRAEVTQRVKPSERLVAEVEQLCGTGSVELR